MTAVDLPPTFATADTLAALDALTSADVLRSLPEPPFGSTGRVVYERTYSRKTADGTPEVWGQTVARVVLGNMALAHGPMETWSLEQQTEALTLFGLIYQFGALPAGRHLKSTGVKGRQFLYNCHVAPWGDLLSRHLHFTFMRLMEGGGVGANYSERFLEHYATPARALRVHIVCDPGHKDYEAMKAAGLLSDEYDSDWTGAFPVEDTREGWADALVDLVDTYWLNDVKHLDRVYDVTTVREKGARLKTMGGVASGPLPLAEMLHSVAATLNTCHIEGRRPGGLDAMNMDHAIAMAVVSGGTRRSARMAQKHWADKDIFAFINSKADSGSNWTTNISIEIDDAFIQALDAGDEHAQAVYRAAVTGMLTNGEPGLWNSSLSNVGEVNEVIATNPCGEIALPPAGACVLGNVNLEAFAPRTRDEQFDLDGAVEASRLMTRFLIRATYGDMNDPEQAHVMGTERRIGVGHFGVQGALARMGIRYTEAPEHPAFVGILRTLKAAVRQEARDYAFALRIPEPVKVTDMAPTGSTAKVPGATEGAHAIYARYFLRRIRFNVNSPEEYAQVEKALAEGFHVEDDIYAPNTVVVTYPTKEALVAAVEAMGYPADLVESQDEIPAERLFAFQAAYQEHYADNAVSFTANVPAEPHQQAAMLSDPFAPVPTASPDRVAEVMATLRPFLPRLKGTTMMLDGARPQAPYERITGAEFEAATGASVGEGYDEQCASGACPI